MLLKYTLLANAMFSLGTAICIFLMWDILPQSVGGLESSGFIIIGVLLVIFAADLFHNAFSQQIDLQRATISCFMDALWVVGSGLATWVLNLPFTALGRILVLSVALVVLLFGVLQFYGILRLRSRPLNVRYDHKSS